MIIKKAQLRRLDEIYRSILVTKIMKLLEDDLARTLPDRLEPERRKIVMDSLVEADILGIRLDNERTAYVVLKLYNVIACISETDFINMIERIKLDSATVLSYELSIRISLNII